MLCKILRAILAHPSEAKYRSIKLHSDAVQKALVRPLGAWVTLRQLGFQLNAARSHLTCERPDLGLLARELDRFARVTDHPASGSVIPGLFAHVQGDHDAQSEEAFHTLIELQKVLHNVLSAPEERNFRSIDKSSDVYLRRLAPVPAAQTVLAHYGFRDHKNQAG